MLTVTSTRPRDSREVIRFLIDGSTEASSEPTRRWMSRKRLLTVFRSTETEKSSPATIPLPYPVIDFIGFLSTDYTDSFMQSVESAESLLPQRIEARKAFDISRPGAAVPRECPSL